MELHLQGRKSEDLANNNFVWVPATSVGHTFVFITGLTKKSSWESFRNLERLGLFGCYPTQTLKDYSCKNTRDAQKIHGDDESPEALSGQLTPPSLQISIPSQSIRGIHPNRLNPQTEHRADCVSVCWGALTHPTRAEAVLWTCSDKQNTNFIGLAPHPAGVCCPI